MYIYGNLDYCIRVSGFPFTGLLELGYWGWATWLLDFLATGLLYFFTSLPILLICVFQCLLVSVNLFSYVFMCIRVCMRMRIYLFSLPANRNLFINVILSQKMLYIYVQLNKTSFGMSHMFFLVSG